MNLLCLHIRVQQVSQVPFLRLLEKHALCWYFERLIKMCQHQIQSGSNYVENEVHFITWCKMAPLPNFKATSSLIYELCNHFITLERDRSINSYSNRSVIRCYAVTRAIAYQQKIYEFRVLIWLATCYTMYIECSYDWKNHLACIYMHYMMCTKPSQYLESFRH